MPKSYTKNTWLDRIITGALRYDIKTDAGVSLYTKVQILLNNAVTQAGSQLLAAWMNNIETGVDGLDTLLAGVPPQSQYKIVPTVSSGALTVALKDISGNNFSATNPGYFRIGNAMVTLTSALSITIPAGVGQFNSGSLGLATNELDIFVAVGWNATDGMTLALTRYPGGSQYGDWSAVAANEKYLAINNATNNATHAASTDYYHIIGRFAATNSGTASYNWSVPTYTAINLKNFPICETRWLTYTPQWTGYSSPPTNVYARYKIVNSSLSVIMNANTAGTSNATSNWFSIPFTIANESNLQINFAIQGLDNGVGKAGMAIAFANNAVVVAYTDFVGTLWTNSGSKNVQGFYGTLPIKTG